MMLMLYLWDLLKLELIVSTALTSLDKLCCWSFLLLRICGQLCTGMTLIESMTTTCLSCSALHCKYVYIYALNEAATSTPAKDCVLSLFSFLKTTHYRQTNSGLHVWSWFWASISAEDSGGTLRSSKICMSWDTSSNWQAMNTIYRTKSDSFSSLYNRVLVKRIKFTT